MGEEKIFKARKIKYVKVTHKKCDIEMHDEHSAELM
jgi:hypothetical protein